MHVVNARADGFMVLLLVTAGGNTLLPASTDYHILGFRASSEYWKDCSPEGPPFTLALRIEVRNTGYVSTGRLNAAYRIVCHAGRTIPLCVFALVQTHDDQRQSRSVGEPVMLPGAVGI